MVYLSPAGLAGAAAANSVSLLATFKEKLCRPVCAASGNGPQATVALGYDSPVLNGSTVFVPITATVTIVTPGCGCGATTQVITERFVVAFQGQTELPSGVTVTAEGISQGLIKVVCGKSSCYAVNQSLTVTITPAAAA